MFWSDMAATSRDHFRRWARNLIARQRGTELYQSSTMDALLAGVYDGDVTIAELLRHGDFGLGTFNHLDGEMVVLDGTCHHLRSDGTAVIAALTEQTPFAAITRFHADQVIGVDSPITWAEMTCRVDSAIDSSNLVYGIKIVGEFSVVNTRTVMSQTRPYPPLVEATKGQATTRFTDITGTLAGFRMPDYDEGISVSGFHLHFLDETQSRGGHCLDFQMTTGEIQIATISDLHLSMPDTPDFRHADFTAADTAEQIRETEGGH